MLPWALNENSVGSWGIELHSSPSVRYLAAEPRMNKPDEVLKEFGLTGRPPRPIAIYPIIKIPRVISQALTFTIHPNTAPKNSIPGILTSRKHLVRYIVPGESKKSIEMDLRSIGIHHHTLFPELESLAKGIPNQIASHQVSPRDSGTIRVPMSRRQQPQQGSRKTSMGIFKRGDV